MTSFLTSKTNSFWLKLWRSYEDLMRILWKSHEDLEGLERILKRSWRWYAITRDSLRPFECNLVTNPSSGALLLFWFSTSYTTNVTIHPLPRNTNQRVYDSFTTVVHFSSRYIIIFNDNYFNTTFTEFLQNFTLWNPLPCEICWEFERKSGYFWWIFWPNWSLLNGFDV